MKTNQVRVRQNGHTKTIKPQVKNSAAEIVTVLFYSVDDDKELARVDFPRKAFNAIKRASKELGISLSKFFNLAMLHKLEDAGIEVPVSLTAGGVK